MTQECPKTHDLAEENKSKLETVKELDRLLYLFLQNFDETIKLVNEIGFINSFSGPSLMRAPNQLAFEGIDALHCVSLIVKSTFLSISQSSTKIKLVNLFNPA